jgi:formylglycine-generating enzyme required for sulfatase activity
MPLSQGQILNNRYRIVRLLGQGGFGAVYRAWDFNFDGPVAIKECSHLAPDVVRQFTLEARLLFHVRHPNLPKVYDSFGVPGQGQYLVMEFVDGEDLATMLGRSQAALPEAKVLGWTLQVCDALSYLHRLNPPVIHRDIKPANIRITPDNQAILVDFGISKEYDPNQKTMEGARAVTPGFSPIEQYGMGRTDARSDVYALGATLYNLLTNQIPPESLSVRMGISPPAPPAHIANPAVSPVTSAVIEQAMQIAMAERFASIDAFKVALSSAPLLGRPAGAAAPAPPSQAVAQSPAQAGAELGTTAPARKASRAIPQQGGPPLPGRLLTLGGGISLSLVHIPAGPFRMGVLAAHAPALAAAGYPPEWLAGEQPQHEVLLSDYWIGKTPVTVAQFQAFILATGYRTSADRRGSGWVWNGTRWEDVRGANWRRPHGPGSEMTDKEDYPVTQVGLEDAQAFCQWASHTSGAALSVPSEAQWEKAGRGLDGRSYPWGDQPPDTQRCNFNRLVGEVTPPGRYSPAGDSPFGCQDMAGNIWEWVSDHYNEQEYAQRAAGQVIDPPGAASGKLLVLRGGSWYREAAYLRCASRFPYDPATKDFFNCGFRVVAEGD